MSSGSTKVVYAGLIGDLLVAVSKLAASLISGSSAMLTEAIHSFADMSNQLFLLVGEHRGKTPADDSHQFGYGLETYFWAFVVGVMVVLFGGAVSIYEGFEHLRAGTPVGYPKLNLVVLALSFVFEGASFVVGYKEYRRLVAGRPVDGEEVGLWQFIKLTKDPSLYASLLGDVASLVGIVLAAIGVVLSAYLRIVWADGAASMMIGVLLVADGAVIMAATRSLIGGESALPLLRGEIARILSAEPLLEGPTGVATLQLGPQTILVSLTLNVSDHLTVGRTKALVTDVTHKLRTADSRLKHVLIAFAP